MAREEISIGQSPGEELHVGGACLWMSGVDICFPIDATLLEKKVPTSSAVREVEEGGGGGGDERKRL